MAIGKWILTGLGWTIGGPIGGILGYLLGSIFSGTSGSSQEQPPRRRPYRNTGTQEDINVALLVLIAAIMKADGVVKRSELDYVKRFLVSNYGETKALELLSVLRDLVKKDIPTANICAQIKVNTDYTTRYHMFDFLCGLATADGETDRSEEHV